MHMNSLLLVYALTFLSTSNYVCGCIETEKQVLLHFNKSRVIDHKYVPIGSWVGDDCCSWAGIHCNNDGHVIDLDLSGLSLTGDLISKPFLVFDLKYRC